MALLILRTDRHQMFAMMLDPLISTAAMVTGALQMREAMKLVLPLCRHSLTTFLKIVGPGTHPMTVTTLDFLMPVAPTLADASQMLAAAKLLF